VQRAGRTATHLRAYRLAITCLVALAAQLNAQGGSAANLPLERDYDVIVASEAVDQLAVVRFGPGGARVLRTTMVGMNPMEPDGPHGIGMAPDGKSLYVSTAHGNPYGSLWKLDPATGKPLDRVELGNFPATLQVSPDGIYVFVVNFNLHGEMVPSSVSVVSTDPFVEVARLTTCTMPHGSRFNGAGTKHYSACMMDEALVEIDALRLSVSRHFLLTKGMERGGAGAPNVRGTPKTVAAGSADAHVGHGLEPAPAGNVICSPTWAQPSLDGKTVFVACNKSSDIVEIDADTWTMRRRIPAGEGVYNLALTRDGKLLVATNKRGQSVSIIDAVTGTELGRIPTKRRVVHGVAISSDDRYAFVTVEGIGSEPGTVELIDLRSRARIASVDVGQMAGGIDVLPSRLF
jgi:DNA-binding beta-propeller fold protein YncE